MTDKNALWQKGHDQEVQVNQRALIDKVLARYSGEFTVFRELLQNSDDADATNAEIHFNTQAYKDRVKSGTPKQHLKEGSSNYALQNLKTRPLAQWIFRNDGMPFRDQDWDRLKKIAKGNPDEKKIGAFGVGFYSLFSITDEPFVKSEKQWMGFYWKNKGDQLFTRRGELASPPELSPSGKPWTSFEMPLRQPSPLPGLLIDLARFLATSVTFMVNLRDVSVFVDGLRLIQIQKDIGPINPLSLPNDLNPTSTLNTMVVKTLNSQEISISAHLSRYVYYHSIEKSTGRSKRGPTSFKDLLSPVFTQFASTSRPLTPTEEPQDWTNDEADPLEVLHSSVNLHIYSAGVDVTLEENMISELERATKKKPPSTCSYSLIYVSLISFYVLITI
ncbi:hypothetical protein FRC03_008701 [Tulasnella sp. 419]|nr:hypothetical protein FRC03_008701 [Tulasnella sp. 419]